MCLISPLRPCIPVYGRLAAAAGLMEIVLDHKFLMGLAGFPELREGGTPPPTMLDGIMLVTCLILTHGAPLAIVVPRVHLNAN